LAKRARRLPTLTAADVICVIQADGWTLVKGTKHLAFEHPTKPGKVNVSQKWTHVRPGGWPLTAVLAQAGLTKDEFDELYWRHCG
jgi:predicted RNA binding protein YcfA (HicA-like mRNA interferase family)